MRRTLAQKTKRYSEQQRYRNPFFSRRKRRATHGSLKPKLLIAMALIAVCGSLWFLLYHPYFTITEVAVRGSRLVPEYDIRAMINNQLTDYRWLVVPQTNIFAFHKQQLRDAITRKYYVHDLVVDKTMPRGLTVSFQEQEPVAIWLEDDLYYYVDADFYLITKAETIDVENSSLVIVTQAGQGGESLIIETPLARQVDITPDYLNATLSLFKKLGTLDIPTSRTVSINKKERTINVGVVDGPVIYFNAAEDVDRQFTYLETLLREQVRGDQIKKLNYIDLRFGEKIYYK